MNLADLSVLVADDDARARSLMLDMLEAIGVRSAASAGDAQGALATLEQRTVHVLLCARQLGVDAGLARDAKRASPDTLVVLLGDDGRAAARAGAAAHLPHAFDLEALGALLERSARGLGGLRGHVQALSLTDILQMYHHGRQSIALRIAGPVTGCIRLEHGELVHAESGGARGVPALSRLLGAKSGVLTTELSPAVADTSIHQSFQAALLEAITAYDEQRGRPSSEPLQTEPLQTEPLPPEPLPPEPLPHEPQPEPLTAAPRMPAERLPQEPAAERAETPVDLARAAPRSRAHDVHVPELVPDPSPARPARGGARSAVLGALFAIAVVVGGGYGLAAWRRARMPEPVTRISALEPKPIGARAPAPAATSSAGAAPSAARAGDATAADMTLELESIPPGAAVLENGRVLGHTPLSLTLERDSLQRGARRFSLQHSGYAPYLFEQRDSALSVRATVALEPLAATGAAGSLAAAPAAATPKPAPRPARTKSPRGEARKGARGGAGNARDSGARKKTEARTEPTASSAAAPSTPEAPPTSSPAPSPEAGSPDRAEPNVTESAARSRRADASLDGASAAPGAAPPAAATPSALPPTSSPTPPPPPARGTVDAGAPAAGAAPNETRR